MERVHNFNAGPAVLPEEVLREAQADLVNYKGMGLSVMEMSHRSKSLKPLSMKPEMPQNGFMVLVMTGDVLFLHGGASLQFVMVPMNFLPEGKIANFIHTGVWSKKQAEVKKLQTSAYCCQFGR